jgi:hypothetical protein
MSIPIKVSELSVLEQITNDDYIVVNDSGSVTTKRATFDTLSDYLSGSLKPVRSASYALSASYSKFAQDANFAEWCLSADFATSSSYSSRSSYATYVNPAEPLPANTINVVGTASWAASSSNLPNILFDITASLSKTASYLFHDPNWNTTGVLNGTASYALSASVADVALNIQGGVGISGTGTENYLTRWSATGVNQPLEDSQIWNNGQMIVIGATDETEAVNTFNAKNVLKVGMVYMGGHIIITGSAAFSGEDESSIKRSMSPMLIFANQLSEDDSRIYFSASYYDGSWDHGSMIFENYYDADEPWIFRTFESGLQRRREHVIIKPNLDDTYVDISGSLFVHDYAGIGNLMSRTGVGARLHVSGSTDDTVPMFVTEATNPSTNLTYLGLYVTKLGQVGIGTTQPQTRLETIGSFSSPEYYVKDGANYLKGISGTWIVFNTSDPNGIASRTYLTFNNGILVSSAVAPPWTPSVIPPLTPPTETPTPPPSGGGGGGCPAIWQEIETLELGFVPAEKVEKGMHLKGVDGWNLVFNAYNEEADIWRVVVNGENYDVDESHLWLVEKNTWRRVTELKQHDFIMDSRGNYISVDDVYFLKRGLFRHLEVDRKAYVLGSKKLVGHNVTQIPVEKN